MLNLEVKAEIQSIETAIPISAAIGASFVWEKSQTDVYFFSPSKNRLKIRIEDGEEPYLVIYDRPNSGGARECEYFLYSFSQQTNATIRHIFTGQGTPFRNTMFVLPCSAFCKTCCNIVSQNRFELSDKEKIEPNSPVNEILNMAISTSVIVKKTRMLFMWENVRIHLDDVENLGTFIEFEHPVGKFSVDEALARLDFLFSKFGISRESTEELSYSDLLRRPRL